MSFDYPAFLFCIGLLVPLTFLSVLHYSLRRDVLTFFLPSPGSPSGRGREFRFRYLLSVSFFLLFFACLAIALAGPRWGTRLVPEFRQGADVVLVMDLSRSMDVRDGGERGRSRLEQAAVIAGELPALSRGTRFAVVIGKGTGVLAVPLTDDAEAVSAFLEGLSTSLVTGRGTNLESLVTAAARAFQDSFPTRRHIILFSDGEAHQGSFFQGIENALARNISITAVGLGSEAGGVVPSASGRDGGPEADLVSFLRRDALRDAAERTGGIYLDGTNERAAAFLAGHIIAASPESGGAGDPGPADFRRERVSRSYIFILTALAAFGLSWACGKKRKRRET